MGTFRATALVLVGLLAACTGGQQGPGPSATEEPTDAATEATLDGEPIVLTAALQPFDSCDALLDYFQREALEVVGPYGLDGLGPFYYGDVAVDAAAADSSVAGSGAEGAARSSAAPVEGQDFSGTNVQEEGVDEPDSVKTNGELVIAMARGKLQIVDLAEPDQVLSTLRLEGWSHELFLDGDRVLVMASQESQHGPVPVDDVDIASHGYGASAVSVLTLIDISDPANPRIEATLTLDGVYHSARMVDGVARVVLSSQPTGLSFTFPEGGGLRAQREAEEANREVIRDSTIDDWLPYYVIDDRRGDGGAAGEGTLLECENVARPEEFAGFGLVSVLSVDLSGDLAPGGGTAVVSSGETVYASSETLYVATNRWFDPIFIERNPDEVEDAYSTEIHAFDIRDPGSASYLASGEVRGHLLNQFSMSEHDGTLRVATTDGSPWGGGRRSESFVTVLERSGERLRRVGQVGDLGKGEQIYSVRFIDDTGYVVTFRQTDPLYTIDLSDPTSPRVTGELKILGYSAYLHPVADDLLLGVGQDADRQGRTKGLQLSLFDVSDPNAPRRLQQETIRGGYSDAEYDHRAFLYWPQERLTVVPVQSYRYNERTGAEHFETGARAYTVTRSAIDAEGVVRHAPPDNPTAYEGAIRRSMVVGDSLVTVSELGLKVNELQTLDAESFVRFR